MLNDKDIDNLAKTLDEFEWRFNPDDANSIHIWTRRNPDSIVYYQQQRESEQTDIHPRHLRPLAAGSAAQAWPWQSSPAGWHIWDQQQEGLST